MCLEGGHGLGGFILGMQEAITDDLMGLVLHAAAPVLQVCSTALFSARQGG